MLELRPITIRVCYIPVVLVVLGTLVNGLCNSLAVAFGYDYPFTTFLFMASDKFADFYKVALSFPGAEPDTSTWLPFIARYQINNPFGGLEALGKGQLTHFHITPIRELIYLGIRRLFSIFNPLYLFIVYFSCWTGAVAAVAWRYLEDKRLWVAAMLALVFSYPYLFIVTRGNLSSSLAGVALIIAILLALDQRRPWLVCLLLAVAINFRPNAIVFVGILLVFRPFASSLKYIFVTALLALAIAAVALQLAHYVYPDYTYGAFKRAVAIYHRDYAMGDSGLAFGSSLLGALKIFGLAGSDLLFTEKAIGFSVVASGLLFLINFLRDKISGLGLIFLMFALYVLGIGAFADYHLIPAFAILLFLCRELSYGRSLSSADLVILLATVFVLIPKSIFYTDELISYQVVLNPMILLGAAIYVYSRSWVLCTLQNRR